MRKFKKGLSKMVLGVVLTTILIGATSVFAYSESGPGDEPRPCLRMMMVEDPNDPPRPTR